MAAKIIKGGGKKGGEIPPARHIADIVPDSSGVVHKRIIDARQKAEEIIADARKEAERIRAEAEAVLQSAEMEKEDAIRKGYADGESKGLAKITEKLIALEHLKEKFYEHAESEVVKLVMGIAEKIMGDLAVQNKDFIKIVVKQALERALGDRITVRLNPADYKTAIEGEEEFKSVIDRTKRLLFREDDAVSRGGCVVETEVGTIDAELETQLEAIRKALYA